MRLSTIQSTITQYRPLPLWLNLAVIFAFFLSSSSVTVLAFLTLGAFLEQPLNPMATNVENVAESELPPLNQEGPVPLATLSADEITPTPLPTPELWQGTNRVTILLMGIDRRPDEPFISRTDSMLLLSMNPDTNEASVLSIPRDLYVVIPDIGRDRINTAFVYGAKGNNPAGGADLAMRTVEYNLGVSVDYYMMIDFSAVIASIDTIGGVDVNVPFEIYDPTYPDMNYGYDPLYIPAGNQHLDGILALKYARTRHVDNDFGRAQRQQQVLFAMREKVLDMGMSGLLRQAPFLWQQLQEGVRTDLSLEQLIQLSTSAGDIPRENIHTAVLNYDYVVSYRTEGGASVLVSINERVAPLIQDLFYD